MEVVLYALTRYMRARLAAAHCDQQRCLLCHVRRQLLLWCISNVNAQLLQAQSNGCNSKALSCISSSTACVLV
jgi:hypothetical protein